MNFSAVKAAIHWYVLYCGVAGVAAIAFIAAVEYLGYLGLAGFIAQHQEAFAALAAIAGIAWMVVSAWYIGQRDGYIKRVVPARRQPAGCCGGIIHAHYFHPESMCLIEGCHPFAPHYDDDD